QRRWPFGGRDDGPDPVAAGDRQDRHGRTDIHGEVRLSPADGPEIEAAGAIDQDGDIEITFLEGVPDIGFTCAPQDLPVHAANVVARLVRPRIPRFDPVTEHERRVAAASAGPPPPAAPRARGGAA